MSTTLIIALCYIAVFVLVLCVPFVITNKTSYRLQPKKEWIYYILFAGFTLSFSVFAYHVVPIEGNDLNAHYMAINCMRNGQDPGQIYDLGQSDNPMFLFRLLLRLVSVLPSNHYLQVIAVLIIYSIFSYILIDYATSRQLDIRLLSMAFFAHFSMCLMTATISGIRNVLIFAVLALAVYIDFFKKYKTKWIKWLLVLLLYLFPLFVHPAGIVIIVLRISLLFFKRYPKLIFVLAFWRLGIGIVAKILLKVPLALPSYLGFKINDYITSNNLFEDWRWWTVLVLLLSFILYLLYSIRKTEMKAEFKNYYLLFLITIMFTFGSSSTYHLFTRMFIFISFLMLPLLEQVFLNCKSQKLKISYFMIFTFFFSGLILYNFVSIHGNMDFAWGTIT